MKVIGIVEKAKVLSRRLGEMLNPPSYAGVSEDCSPSMPTELFSEPHFSYERA